MSETFTTLQKVLTSFYKNKTKQKIQKIKSKWERKTNIRKSMMTGYESNNYTKPTHRFANHVSLSTGCHCQSTQITE